MKSLVVVACLFVAAPAFAGVMPGYECEATGLKVTISGDASAITVLKATSTATYKIVRITSKSGDTDQTFETADGVSVTIDDQYGDALTEANGQTTPLKCRN